jgi:hypothetical protein
MSIYQYLQLQTVDPQDDGTISDLDQHDVDETIDLTQDEDGDVLARAWADIEKDMHATVGK